jgi:excisionase family DNA binding protein
VTIQDGVGERVQAATDLLLAEAADRAEAPCGPISWGDVTGLLVAVAALTASLPATSTPCCAPEVAIVPAALDDRPVVDTGHAEPTRYWLSTTEAAAHTGVSERELYEALRTRELTGSQRAKGRKWRVHRDDLDRWMRGEGNR